MKKENGKGKKEKQEFRHLVERFRQMQQHEEVAKEAEFKRRRDGRVKRKLAIKTDKRLVQYKRLYIISTLALLIGSIMTFGSVVKGLGEGSILWTYRTIFVICGPAMVGFGVLLLLVRTGLVHERQAKIKRRLNLPMFDMGHSFNSSNFSEGKRGSCQNESVSKPLLLREESSSGSSATDTSAPYSSREKSSDNKSKLRMGRQPSEESEMDVFLDSSLSSGESNPAGLSFSAKWAALAKIPEQKSSQIKQNGISCKKQSSTSFVLQCGTLRPHVVVSMPENNKNENDSDKWKTRDVKENNVLLQIGKQTSI